MRGVDGVRLLSLSLGWAYLKRRFSMNHFMFHYLSLFLTLFCLAAFDCFAAEGEGQAVGDAEKAYVLDGVTYTKDQIIEDFLNVAFSDLPWNADAGEEDQQKILNFYLSSNPKLNKSWWDFLFNNKTETNQNKGKYNSKIVPWLAPHLAKNMDLPLNRRNVITKWPGSHISIGIDWPRYTLSEKHSYGKYAPKVYTTPYTPSGFGQYYDLLLAKAEAQTKALADATGLDVKVVPPDAMVETNQNFPRIRIVPDTVSSIRTWEQGDSNYHPVIDEESLLNGILFQSYTRNYFDGHLLPDSHYNLDLTICKIDPTLEERFLTALINECLIRSLGLPGISKNSHSLLSSWHTIPDLTLYERRKKAFAYRLSDKEIVSFMDKSALKGYEDRGQDEFAERMKMNTFWITLDEKLVSSFSTIPAYERMMISLLYCPHIKPGIGKTEVEGILRESDKCFVRAP